MKVYEQYKELSAAVAQTAAGTTAVVAATANKKVVVTGFVLVANGACTAKFQSNSTDKTGAMSLATNGGISSLVPFECTVGEALNLVTATSFVNGYVTYKLVDA